MSQFILGTSGKPEASKMQGIGEISWKSERLSGKKVLENIFVVEMVMYLISLFEK